MLNVLITCKSKVCHTLHMRFWKSITEALCGREVTWHFEPFLHFYWELILRVLLCKYHKKGYDLPLWRAHHSAVFFDGLRQPPNKLTIKTPCYRGGQLFGPTGHTRSFAETLQLFPPHTHTPQLTKIPYVGWGCRTGGQGQDHGWGHRVMTAWGWGQDRAVIFCLRDGCRFSGRGVQGVAL